MNNSCYVINFYLGDRRKTVNEYKEDKLYFLKRQIEYLNSFKHNLNKIIFTFNIEPEHYHYTSDIFKLVPKFIKNTEVEIIFRENKGFSYGAWSDVFKKYKLKYDYYIFNEDDYFFVDNNWDSYLVNKYNSYNDCGYLCPFMREPHRHNEFRRYAGLSTGIASSNNLLKVWDKYKMLPHSIGNSYENGEEIQKRFSFAFLDVGLNIYDTRDDYRISFGWTEDDGNDIWRAFWWNTKDLIIPAILLNDNVKYNWFQSFDGEFLEGYKPISYNNAMKCYNTKTTYYGEK